MLYQNADDEVLEQDIYLDLNEVELIGSSDRVLIVAQVDRCQAGYQGTGRGLQPDAITSSKMWT